MDSEKIGSTEKGAGEEIANKSQQCALWRDRVPGPTVWWAFFLYLARGELPSYTELPITYVFKENRHRFGYHQHPRPYS